VERREKRLDDDKLLAAVMCARRQALVGVSASRSKPSRSLCKVDAAKKRALKLQAPRMLSLVIPRTSPFVALKILSSRHPRARFGLSSHRCQISGPSSCLIRTRSKLLSLDFRSRKLRNFPINTLSRRLMNYSCSSFALFAIVNGFVFAATQKNYAVLFSFFGNGKDEQVESSRESDGPRRSRDGLELGCLCRFSSDAENSLDFSHVYRDVGGRNTKKSFHLTASVHVLLTIIALQCPLNYSMKESEQKFFSPSSSSAM
jgi:hypothetical protein